MSSYYYKQKEHRVVGNNVLPLQKTACTVFIRQLLERRDYISDYSRACEKFVKKMLGSDYFAPIHEILLDEYVRTFPVSMTSQMLYYLTPRHIKEISLTRCHNIANHKGAMEYFTKMMERCKNIREIIMDEITIQGGFWLVMETLVKLEPNLTSVSFECTSHLKDSDVQILLRGLPNLVSMNLSSCFRISEEAFLLDDEQMEEPRSFDDLTKPGAKLHSIDFAGCLGVTPTTIKHILELSGPRFLNLNVSAAEQNNATLLWYLAGYSKNSAIQCVEKCRKRLGAEYDHESSKLTSESKIEEYLSEYVSLLQKIREIEKAEYSGPESKEAAAKPDIKGMSELSSPFFKLLQDETEEQGAVDMEVEDDFEHYKHSGLEDAGKTNRLQRVLGWFSRSKSVSKDEDQNVASSGDHTDHAKENPKQIEAKRKDSKSVETRVATRRLPFYPDVPRLYQPHINFLDLCGTNFEDPNMALCLEECFKASQNIQGLLFQHNGVTDEMLKIMAKYNRNLRTVSFFDCPQITDDGMNIFLKGCPKITQLEITGTCTLSDRGIQPLFEWGVDCNLTMLKLKESCLTDVSLIRLATTVGPQMDELELGWCKDLTDAGMRHIAARCTNLKNLQLKQRELDPETVIEIGDNCAEMETLHLSAVSCISDYVVETLAMKMVNIDTLDLSWNSDLTDEGLRSALLYIGRLKKFLLMGLRKVTEKSFYPLIQNYKEWRKVQLRVQEKAREKIARGEIKYPEHCMDDVFKELYLPNRSLSFAPILRYINFTNTEGPDKKRLEEIVAVCQGTLSITNHRGSDVSPRLHHTE